MALILVIDLVVEVRMVAPRDWRTLVGCNIVRPACKMDGVVQCVGYSRQLNAAGKKHIQQIVGSFLYYARAINSRILMALLAIVRGPADDILAKFSNFFESAKISPKILCVYHIKKIGATI
jgi:hypothetical protein